VHVMSLTSGRLGLSCTLSFVVSFVLLAAFVPCIWLQHRSCWTGLAWLLCPLASYILSITLLRQHIGAQHQGRTTGHHSMTQCVVSCIMHQLGVHAYVQLWGELCTSYFMYWI
jgi:hypothetical protein